MSADRFDMTDREWKLLESVLPKGLPGPRRKNDRKVMDGIFLPLRTGTPWRDLPKDCGPYSTCYNRYNRWSKKGLWEKILEDFQKLVEESAGRGDDDDDGGGGGDGDGGGGTQPVRSRMIDSSTVRVHRHAAGSRRDSGPREMGRSRGGLTTKIHAMVDEGGRPRRMHLSPGQASDCGGAMTLLEGLEAGTLPIADRAYDTNSILERVAAAGCTAAIPSKSNRRIQRPLDEVAYAGRNVIDCFFGRIKEFRRVATRYDKLARTCLSAIILAATRFLLRDIAKSKIGYRA